MTIKASCVIPFLLWVNAIFGQQAPVLNIAYSKLLATYDFVQKLSDNYPDNAFKQRFKSSKFNTNHYNALIKQLDTLRIYESYSFRDYPMGQKTPVMTTSLIEKYLIHSASIQQFKKQTAGIIPNTDLLALSLILESFETIYDSLIFSPNKDKFEKQLSELKAFVQKSNLSDFFQTGLNFYSTQWDNGIPIDIAIIPSINQDGFTARAFLLNNAISEVPLDFKANDVLFSVLMHEIYHNIYDGQSLELKLKIQSWFNNSASKNSQYAYLLLNEALATAIGNGYVYERLTGKTDKSDWYNIKYINLIAKQIYPLVKNYLDQKKPIDNTFVNEYITLYDTHSRDWVNELDNLLANRFVITDNPGDFDYIGSHYRFASNYLSESPINQNTIKLIKETPITKVIILSSDHKNKLNQVKAAFPELKNWKYKAQQEFVYTVYLQDKTWLIIINQHLATTDELFKKYFRNKRIE